MDRRQKTQMFFIMLLMLVGGVLESMSITLILPLLQILLNPESVEGDGICGQIYRFMGFHSAMEFAVFMLILLVAAFAVKNLFLFFQNVYTLRFVYTNQFATSRRMMINFMRRPYEYYLNADTAVIQRSITSDVNNMYGLILNTLQLGSELVVFACIIGVLVFADAAMILTISVLLMLVLLLIKKVLKPIMIKAGKDNQDYYAGLFKLIDESVEGIKEIKIARKEDYFIDEYAKCGEGYVNAVQKYNVFNSTPRLLIETIMIAGMVGYLLFMLLSGADMAKMVPQLSVFSLAAMRLLPSANRINNYLTNISYFEPFFMGVSDNLQEEIHDESVDYGEERICSVKSVRKDEIGKGLHNTESDARTKSENGPGNDASEAPASGTGPVEQSIRGKILTAAGSGPHSADLPVDEPKKLPVTRAILLKDITYRYPGSEPLIFDHADLEIPVGAALGIVGTSGAGKTTLVDILLGLLEVENGVILADDVDVKTNYGGWLKNIGYIPQTIFMLDSTIRKNVAFGIPEEQIPEEKVWRALKEAQLDEFVRSLPEGLDTGIGERGIRLSGGQRQRIGIARALFEDPEVLVLDEATSALDGETEAAIMDSINRLHGKKTLIIIAHRLQTIEKCDLVYRVEGGKVTRER